MIDIMPLSAVAPDRIDSLLDAAFGTDRRARTAYKVRAGMPALPQLSFAALDTGTLVGTLQAWPVALAPRRDPAVPLVLVGPVAVMPDVQRGGIGKMLMQALLAAAAQTDADAMAMIGDPEYYGRFFGFTADSTGGWELPGPCEPRRLLARISRPGGLPTRGLLGPDPAFLQKPIAA